MNEARLVLLGCGHAHLFVLEALANDELRDVRATLVSPEDEYFYSGMVPGIAAGSYRPEAARLRPSLLAAAAGAEWVQASAQRVSPSGRTVTLANGGDIPYDLLSIDIGSRPAGLDTVPGASSRAIPVKPMRELLARLPALGRGAGNNSERHPLRVLIVGAGAAGVELAFCLDVLLRERLAPDAFRIQIAEAGPELLAGYPARFRDMAAGLLEERGINVRTQFTATLVSEGSVANADGDSIAWDHLVWATGPGARPLPARSGLEVDESGFLRVHPTLQAFHQPRVFAAGDCISLEGHPGLPRAGVFAVREGPLLAENLGRSLRGEPLRRYEPQKHWLSLMNTGAGRALLAYRGFSHHSRAAWWLKDAIDRRFMRRFQRLEAAEAE